MEFQISYKINISNDLLKKIGDLYDAKAEEELVQASIFLIKTALLSQTTIDTNVSEIKITRIFNKQLS